MARFKPSRPTITRITRPAGADPALPATIPITPPVGCCATVLLRQVGSDTARGEFYYAWWLVVGRIAVGTLTVPIEFDGEEILRFDVPDDTLLSTEYLQEHLLAFWNSDPSLPPDTPVIKG